jgi:LysR family pca operon transcriptional activator
VIDARMKIRHLQCFLEVARLGHVGRAAEQLFVTQPAVSKTIRELEDILAVQLFSRSRNGLALTSFGEIFQHYAATGIVALQQAIDSVAQGRMRGDTIIRVGALPSVGARIVPQAVLHLTAARVDATVSLVSAPNRFLIEGLKSRDLDIVVGRLAQPEQMVGLTFEQLYSERLVVVVRPGHPLAASPTFDLKRIADYTVIMPGKEDITRPTVDRLLIANGIGTLERRIETVSSDFSRAFLQHSDAVWVISYGVAALDLGAGSLVELPADVSDTMGPVGMTTRADEQPSPIVSQFMKATRVAAEQIRGALEVSAR